MDVVTAGSPRLVNPQEGSEDQGDWGFSSSLRSMPRVGTGESTHKKFIVSHDYHEKATCNVRKLVCGL